MKILIDNKLQDYNKNMKIMMFIINSNKTCNLNIVTHLCKINNYNLNKTICFAKLNYFYTNIIQKMFNTYFIGLIIENVYFSKY